MRRISLIFLAVIAFPASVFAGPFWDGLTAAQQQSILNGNTVTVVTDANSVLTAASYVWVHNADPAAAAAVYWDFNGAQSYLSAAGVQSYTEVPPASLSAKNIAVALSIPGLPLVNYSAEATAYRLGAKAYSVRWHVPLFDVQPAPGLRSTHGAADFEDFPGANGGALFIESSAGILTPAVANDPTYEQQTVGFNVLMANLLKARFEQGASLAQLLKLTAAVLP
jgi:hypothetical protein